jgi:hypothetical protein
MLEDIWTEGTHRDADASDRMLHDIRSDVGHISERIDDLVRWVGRLDRAIGELRKQVQAAE